jgi:carboxyl-terminal processing protease
MRGGAALKLTTAKYFTPSGRCIHRETNRRQVRSSEDIKIGKTAEVEPDPEFETRMGRRVYGGGGIVPDVTVPYPRLSAVAERLERNLMFYKFAFYYIEKHEAVNTDAFKVTPDVVSEFRQFLEGKNFEYTEKEFEDSRQYVERAVARDIMVQLSGEEAGFKVHAEGDPQVQKGFEILRKAHTRQELFTVAQAMAPPGEGSPTERQ